VVDGSTYGDKYNVMVNSKKLVDAIDAIDEVSPKPMSI